MVQYVEGTLTADSEAQFALVVSRFNDFITSELLKGCIDSLCRRGADADNIDVFKVPGAFEIPGTARKIAKSGSYNAVICLGAVIRGDTPHFDYVAAEASKGVAHVSMESTIPVVFGILTCDTIEQAIERAGTKAGNKGADAAENAIEMVSLYSRIG